jgi:hypothetical protein
MTILFFYPLLSKQRYDKNGLSHRSFNRTDSLSKKKLILPRLGNWGLNTISLEFNMRGRGVDEMGRGFCNLSYSQVWTLQSLHTLWSRPKKKNPLHYLISEFQINFTASSLLLGICTLTKYNIIKVYSLKLREFVMNLNRVADETLGYDSLKHNKRSLWE